MKRQTLEINYKKNNDSVEIVFKKNDKKIIITPINNKIELKKIYEYLSIEEKESISINKKCIKIDKPSSEGKILYNNCLILFQEIEKEINKLNK